MSETITKVLTACLTLLVNRYGNTVLKKIDTAFRDTAGRQRPARRRRRPPT